MWLSIKTIEIRILHWKNSNWLMTLFSCSNFFCVTKEYSKNNALLSSVIPHAKLMTEFINLSEISEKVSNVCETLAKNIREAFERRFYINNNLNLNNNELMLVTTAVDPRYRL